MTSGASGAASAATVHSSGDPGASVQAGQQRGQRGRRREAAAQVVDDLPARHQRQAVAGPAVAGRHDRKQPRQDLPVAAHPAMHPPRMRQHARRVVVDDLDVGDEADAREEPFEQVVRQHGVLGHAALEHAHEGVDVVEALAREDALVEQVLVDVGHGRRVRIDAGVPGIQAREARARGAGHRHAHARLQDAVALDHAALPGVDARPVERMLEDADQRAHRLARQAGVGVEREAVAHVGQHPHVADLDRVAGVAGAAQTAVELLDLAALALPAHPDAFGRRSTAVRDGRRRSDRARRRRR